MFKPGREGELMAFSLAGSTGSSLRLLESIRTSKAAYDNSTLRVASGLRINSSSDDPGGLALGTKLQSEATLANAIKSSVDNAKSYADAQVTALTSIQTLIADMQTAKAEYDAATGDAATQATKQNTFENLQKQVYNLSQESFNGQSLFNRGANMSVVTSTDGGQSIVLEDIDLSGAGPPATGALLQGSGTYNFSDTTFTDALSSGTSSADLTAIADAVTAKLGEASADSSVLGYASSFLESKATNLEAARSNIMDADAAEELINQTKHKIQYETAVAALAQANATQETVMNILLFGKTGN